MTNSKNPTAHLCPTVPNTTLIPHKIALRMYPQKYLRNTLCPTLPTMPLVGPCGPKFAHIRVTTSYIGI